MGWIRRIDLDLIVPMAAIASLALGAVAAEIKARLS